MLWIVGVYTRESVYFRKMWFLQNRRPRSRYPVPERCVFAILCELNRLGQSSEVLNVSPQTVSRCKSWRRYQKSSLLVNSRSWEFLCSRTLLLREFFLVPSRPLLKPNCSHQFETAPWILSRFTEWMVEAFRIEVCGFFSFQHSLNFHDSMHWHLWRLGELFPWIAVPSETLLNPTFVQEETLLFHTTSFHHQDRGTSSVHARISARVPWLSEFEIPTSSFPLLVQSISLNIEMKIIRSVNFSGSVFRFCKSFWITWRICNDVNPGNIFPLEFNCFYIDSQQFFVNKVTFLNSSTWPRHLSIASKCSYIFNPWHRNRIWVNMYFFLLSTWSLDQEMMEISSMREMYFQSYFSLRICFQNVSNNQFSVWFWTNSEFLEVRVSCILWNYPRWMAALLTKDMNILHIKHICLYLVLSLQVLSSLFPHQFPGAGRSRRFIFVSLFPGVCMLSVFHVASLENIRLDLGLGWSAPAGMTASYFIDIHQIGWVSHILRRFFFFFALNGLCNNRFMGFRHCWKPLALVSVSVNLHLKSLLASLWHGALLSGRIRKKIVCNGCKRTLRNSQCWTNGEDDSTHHVWNFLWSACQRVVFWCQHLIWIFGSRWILSTIKHNSVSSGHVSHCWTSSFDHHLDDNFVIFRDVQLRLALRRMCVCGYVVHIGQLINISLAPFSWCLGLGFVARMLALLSRTSF